MLNPFLILKNTAGWLVVLALGSPFSIRAATLTSSSGNSIAQVDTGSQAGMYSWSVDGQNQLNQQWFWYAVGNAAPNSIDTISAAVSTQPTANSLNSTYTGAGFNLNVKYDLTGGNVGSGASDIAETITINNSSASTMVFHFYQYSDFNLAGSPTGDQVSLGKNLSGSFNEAYQTDGTFALSETVVAPGANHGEVATDNFTLNRLNGGAPLTLNDSTSASGNVTWAFQWDLSIAAGGSKIISKDKNIELSSVPEPTTAALLTLGLIGYGMRKNRAQI